MSSPTALQNGAIERSQPDCADFHALSEELRQEARLSRDVQLTRDVEAFLEPYRGNVQRLPRSPIERLEAQRLLRRLLIARRC